MHQFVTCLLLLSCALPAQAIEGATLPEPPPATGIDENRARRETLARRVAAQHPGERIVILMRGENAQPDMGAFAQGQDFLYLSGTAEPGLALVLIPDADGRLVHDELLVPPYSRFAATWDGNFLAPGEAAAARTGFATVGNVRSLERRLDELLPRGEDGTHPILYTLTRPAPRTGSTASKAAGAIGGQQRDGLDGRASRESALQAKLLERFAELRVEGLEPTLGAMRQIKSPHELELLRASTSIAAEGIAEAMKSVRPGMYEYQVAAAARYVFSLRGAGPDAYAAIVGGGPNGCILHYNACTRKLHDDDLIVMDYAPTLHGYASDVTRTFPASGRFTPAQRRLVEDVHAIQQQLLAMVKPGARLSVIGRRCRELLRDRGYRSDHGPCHHVGLAVHDPSTDVLAPGMVITVEPGAYLRMDGMGCRIEDTVLVTVDGHENLSAGLPSAPDAIEALMRQPGITAVPVGLRRR